MNNLQMLVNRHINKSTGATRTNIVKALGYSNINKGLRRFDHVLASLQGFDKVKHALVQVLAVSLAELDGAYRLASMELEQEKAQAFRPFFRVVTSSAPRPIFAASLFPQIFNIAFLFDESLSAVEQLSLACNAYKAHFEQYQGAWPHGAGGEFSGAIYAPKYDEQYHIKNNFEICTRIIKPASASVMRLTLKGKDISSVMGNDGLVLLNTRSVR
jgi:hypothetical protein